MIKEICLGFALAGVIFLAAAGYDITPFLFLGAVGLGLYYFAHSRGLIAKNFSEHRVAPGRQISFEDVGGQASAIQELKMPNRFKNWVFAP